MIRRRGTHDLIVIGGGVAGLSAAAYVARFGRQVALAEARGIFGGLIANIGRVDGVLPSYTASGQGLATDLMQACTSAGVAMLDGEVTSVANGGVLKVAMADGKQYPARTIIVASGGTLRKLKVPGEDEFVGSGVSHCATCDGAFFKSGEVVVIGGGNAAAQEAIILSGICRAVTVVSRSPLRACQSYIEQLSARPNVKFIWNATVDAILGTTRVDGVRIRDLRTGSTRDHPCAGVFPFIGVEPNAGFVPAALKDEVGYIRTDESLATEENGIFAAGHVRRGYGGQVAQAAAEGITAGQAALAYLHA